MLTFPVRAGRLLWLPLLVTLVCSCRGPAHPVAPPTSSLAQRQAQNNALLVTAVRSNNAAQVKIHLAQGANPNVRDNSGLAHWQTVEKEWKRDFKAHPYQGPTALMIACWNGNDSLSATLLRAGADPNALGVDYGAAKIVTEDDLDLESHITPLAEALYGGHISTLQFLLHHGANVNARCKEGLSHGATALDLAHSMIPTSANEMSEEQMDGLAQMIKLLEKAGAKSGYP